MTSTTAPTVLYDVRDTGAPVVGTIQAGVGGVLVGLLLLLVVWKRRDRFARNFALLWIAGWGGISAWTAHGIATRYREAQGWIARRDVEVVEGKVENLSAATSDRKGIETFQVGTTIFRIEDGQTKNPGLNRSSIRGGPVRQGATLRLTFHGPSILRIEEIAPPPAGGESAPAR